MFLQCNRKCLKDRAKRDVLSAQENGELCLSGVVCLGTEGAEVLEQSWRIGIETCHLGVIVNLLSGWLPCSVALWEKGGIWCISVHVHACLYVKHFSVLYSFTAVISAHPIHSLDNPHHHFHSGSLASPTRSYLHHQVNPWPIGTSMSHSDRANSTGEI